MYDREGYMHYNQYQRLINIVGGLYENHPGYFDDLTAEERQVLSRVFFYDYDYDSEDCPDDFPESFPDFFPRPDRRQPSVAG